MTDSQIQDLCKRLRQGDPAARKEMFEYVTEKLRPLASMVLRLDFPKIGLQSETEEILHDVLCKLIPYLQVKGDEFCSGIGPFHRLTGTVLRRTLISLVRRQSGSLVGHALPNEADVTNPRLWESSGLEQWRTRVRVHELVDKLEENDREVIEMALYNNLCNADLAHALKIAPGNASRRLAKAKEALGKLILEDDRRG